MFDMTGPVRRSRPSSEPASDDPSPTLGRSSSADVGRCFLPVAGLVGRPPQSSAEHGTTDRLPGWLRESLERRSGQDLSTVRVRLGSSEPGRVGAAAFTREDEIHLGPGQEAEIAHEAWHVVQQRQGRVRPAGVIGGLPVNLDGRLEQEADLEGSRAAAAVGGRAYPAARLTMPQPPPGAGGLPSGTVVQGRWLILGGKTAGQFRGITWQDHRDDEPGGQAENEPPTAWSDQVEVAGADVPGGVAVDDGVARLSRTDTAGRTIAYTLERYAQINPQGRRQNGDVYNPFGRFSTVKAIAFVPRVGLHSDAQFRASAQQYASQIQEVSDWSNERADSGFPVAVRTASGSNLQLASVNALGAVYVDPESVPTGTREQPVKAATNAPLKGLVAPFAQTALEMTTTPSQPMFVKTVASPLITPTTLATWTGKKRDVSQLDVMGVSAADAVEHGGYGRGGGRGWEWLHLIAHSMGGPAGTGPQHQDNLVAGTSECNTQMIMVEEALKHIVGRYQLRAKLVAHAQLVDPERHIAERIVYDFFFSGADGKGEQVFHWEFDPLTRSNPVSGENVFIRLAMRHHLGDGTDFLGANTTDLVMPSGMTVVPPAGTGPSPLPLMAVAEVEQRHAELEQQLAVNGLDWISTPPAAATFCEVLGHALLQAGVTDNDVQLGVRTAGLESISQSRDLLQEVANHLRGQPDENGKVPTDVEIELRGYGMHTDGTVDGVTAQETSVVIDQSPIPDDGNYDMDVEVAPGMEIKLALLILDEGNYVALEHVGG